MAVRLAATATEFDPVRPTEPERGHDARGTGHQEVAQMLEPERRPLTQQTAGGTQQLASGRPLLGVERRADEDDAQHAIRVVGGELGDDL